MIDYQTKMKLINWDYIKEQYKISDDDLEIYKETICDYIIPGTGEEELNEVMYYVFLDIDELKEDEENKDEE